MTLDFEDFAEPSEVDFAQGRKTDRVYLSRSFPAQFGSDSGHPSRFVYKVFDESEEQAPQEAFQCTCHTVGKTPGGRKQIRLHVARESGAVREILIQKVSTKSNSPKIEQVLKLNRNQSNQLIDLIRALDTIPVNGESGIRVDDQLLREIFSDSDALGQAYAGDPERFRDLIRTDASASDVIALQHRREVVAKMREWLENANAFKKASESAGGPEKAWQRLLEDNPWVLGIGLGGQLLTSWDTHKLEQVTTGANLSGAGKRVDALLRTNGIISSLVFAEIKHHDTKILATTEYRSSCWAPSAELSGAVLQVQQSVRMAMRDLGEFIEDRAPDGSRTGEGTFITQPKAYLIVGSLSELTGSTGGPVDDKVHSFELFRRNITHPEIITFDELLARAQWHVELTESRTTGAP
ncbi:Shedu immune nuclease family protein [Corynebacterium flavescens]|uniref:Shedu immune nuclease family protein n=1 Tax=Corynebacterium flavescens TaxID=28028 RepID=UPI002647EB8F|nr:Shedu immune nuclease family protein [Corynebacterium flavescens]MDN6430770.1 DUF4263 domain-containing protein [Corynebacterium flavescens]MDN6475219.1 DUF4263 domain-containing protein [Corynebacterium flavescens]MDN6822657.1 DUF4263 domain-containing protein [Corynebacterium flavescens]